MTDKPFEAFALGDRATFRKTITDADILLFAAVSGDNYGLHIDQVYAETTRFKGRIAHGMLTASLISTVNALILERPGGIFVSQEVRFLRPVRAGDTIEALSEVVEIIPDQRRLRCRTTCTNQHGKIVVDGEAILQKDVA